MNLLIHDLNDRAREKIRGDYDGWNVVADDGTMKPCIGCFSCWNRTPGICAINDGYGNMGRLIHEAGEVTVISRYTYGGFSGPVKNVFDRCLGYVLPQFEVIRGETHHKKRYDETKPFSFVFYGPELTDEEKDSARRYVQAVCANIRGYVKAVEFRVCEPDPADGPPGPHDEPASGKRSGLQTGAPAGNARSADPDRIVILNGSMRNISGNSAKLARKLAEQLSGRPEIIDLKDHMRDMDGLVQDLKDVKTLILCMPLYVDGLPSQLIRFMQRAEADLCGPEKVYVLANMGLYESSQLVNLFSAVRQWCGKAGCEYCGGLGVSAGELLGTLMGAIPFRLGPTKKAAEGMARLADAINSGRDAGEIFAEPYRFPRSLYIFIANTNWNRTAKLNGISPKDLYRKL